MKRYTVRINKSPTLEPLQVVVIDSRDGLSIYGITVRGLVATQNALRDCRAYARKLNHESEAQ